MRKLTIVTKFKNVVKVIGSTYRIPHRDERTGKNTWVTELDFKVEAKKIDTTNNILLNNNKPWSVLEYDLDTIERVDGNAEQTVSFYEVIKAVVKQCPARVAQGVIKFIVTPENKKDIKQALDEEIITSSNTITDAVLKKEQINLVPDLSVDFADEEITGMADIEEKITAARTKQSKKLEAELSAQLKD